MNGVHIMADRYGEEHFRYRGQPRTSTGRFKSRYGRYSGGIDDIESMKENVGAILAHSHGREWIIEKAIKEASEFIQAATKEDEYEMFKEFSELCILMKGAAEFMPADLEEETCRAAKATRKKIPRVRSNRIK